MISCGASRQNIQLSNVIAVINENNNTTSACVGGFNWDHSY